MTKHTPARRERPQHCPHPSPQPHPRPRRSPAPMVPLLGWLMLLGAAAIPAVAQAAAQDDGVACRGRDHYGSLDTPDAAEDAVVVGTTAYVAAGEAGLLIVDIADPHHPAIIGALDTPGVAGDLCVVGTTVYLACDTAGVRIIDASDPAAPFEVNSFKFTPITNAVEVADGIAYVATHDDGLQVVDVSIPFLPRLRSAEPRTTRAYGVAVEGDIAVVTGDADSTARVLDVSDPDEPVGLGVYTTGRRASSATLSGTTLLLPAGDGVHIVDISTPSAPALLAIQPAPGSGSAGPVTLDGDLAYVANGAHGVFVMDIADPGNPVGLGSFDTPGSAGALGIGGVRGTTAVVADAREGLYLVDAARPRSSVVATLALPGNARAMTRSGDHAYIADLTGLLIVDLSNPLAPDLVGSYHTGGSAIGVALSGTTAYLATRSSGVLVLDVADPARPTLLGAYSELNETRGIAVGGTTAFVAHNPLTVLDVSEPSAPTLLSTFDTPGIVEDLAVDGPFLYIADRGEGLRVLDVSDPGAPVEVGHAPTEEDANRVGVFEGVAFVSTGPLLMFDVSNPAAPVRINAYSRDTDTQSEIRVLGDRMCIAGNGLQMADISGLHEPRPPVWIGSQPGISARAVAIEGDLAFVLGAGTLSVVDLRDCGCLVDINHDGLADSRDFLAFLNAWTSGDPPADWDEDGDIDTQDVVAFQQDWAAGCN